MKTKLIIRWERQKEFSESIWERENDGILYSVYSQILRIIDSVSKLGEAKKVRKENS